MDNIPESKRTTCKWDFQPVPGYCNFEYGEELLSSPMAQVDTFVPVIPPPNNDTLIDAILANIKYFGYTRENLTDFEVDILQQAGYNLDDLLT